MEGPRIEEFYLGEPNLEAYYTEFPLSAMAIQPRLPCATKKARALEAHGYHRRSPPGGRRCCFVLDSFDRLDETSIGATRRVIDELAPETVEQIKESYRAAQEPKNAFWIAWDCDEHPYTVIAALRNLAERGELPEG
jgi:hypothetical protein